MVLVAGYWERSKLFSLLLMLEQTHTGMNLRCLISGTPLKGP